MEKWPPLREELLARLGGRSLKIHYANTSVQYTAIFHGCKNGNFQMKKKSDIFLIFAQNIDHW